VRVTIGRTPQYNHVYIQPTRPRIFANNIYKWYHYVLRIPEHTVNVIQIDGKNGTFI